MSGPAHSLQRISSKRGGEGGFMTAFMFAAAVWGLVVILIWSLVNDAAPPGAVTRGLLAMPSDHPDARKKQPAPDSTRNTGERTP